MKKRILVPVLLLAVLASGQVIERTISLRDTFGWLRGAQCFAYDSRRQLGYVCADEDSLLFVLDGVTSAKKARLRVPCGITDMAYDSIDDRLFCARSEADSVVVLDCGTLNVIAAIPVGDAPVATCRADRANKVYVANEGEGTVSVLDCGAAVELARLPVKFEETQLLYNRVSNTVWCYEAEHDSLFVIDCAGDSVAARLDFRHIWHVDCDQRTGKVYCTRGDDYVVVIDGSDFQVCGQIQAADYVVWVVSAWQRGWLYMVEGGGIEVYDCSAGEVVDTIAYDAGDDQIPARYSPEADVVWLAWAGCWCGPGHVGVIDCATNEVLLGPCGCEPLRLHPARNGLTYLCTDDEPMYVLKDADQMFASVVTDGFRLHFVTCNPMDGMVYASGDPPTVVVIDPLLDTTFVHPGIPYLSSGYMNEVENKLYGFNLMAHTVCTDLVVYDGVERRVTGRIPTGDDPLALCVNQSENKLYCSSYGGEDLRVFDGATDSMLAELDLGFAAADLEVATVENKLYCGTHNSPGLMAVIDCRRDSLVDWIPITGGQNDLCYSPAMHKVYSLTCYYGREVKVIDCRTDTVVNTIGIPHPGVSLCLNSRDNKLYVLCPDTGHVVVVNCAEESMVADIAVGSSRQYAHMEACFDAQGNKLYCSVANDDSVAVIDGATDSVVAKLGTGRVPVGVTFDPGTGRLFVANPGDGTVSVFRAPTPAEGRRAGSLARIPTIVKGRLLLPRPHTGVLLDISGGVVCKLKSGYNEVGHCPAGIYFVREARSQSIRKVVVVK